MAASLIVGTPVWDRAWSLPVWFESVRANCEPSDTGLVFVVPTSDFTTREVIERYKDEFAWCEVIRDRQDQLDRTARIQDWHRALAMARNAILGIVKRARPEHYLSWDSDLLVEPGLVQKLRAEDRHLTTVWTWLNRQDPSKLRWEDPSTGKLRNILWQEAMCATVMEWDGPKRAHHLDARHWDKYAQGIWQCDVALAFKLMRPEAYMGAHYLPHPHGEDIPFNWMLEQRRIERWCCGTSIGVHLFDRQQSMQELRMGWPDIMGLAQQKPLAAQHPEKRPFEMEALGFF